MEVKNWNENVAEVTLTDEQKKLISDAYQHVVEAAKLLSEPALLEIPKINESVEVLKNAETKVGALFG